MTFPLKNIFHNGANKLPNAEFGLDLTQLKKKVFIYAFIWLMKN